MTIEMDGAARSVTAKPLAPGAWAERLAALVPMVVFGVSGAVLTAVMVAQEVFDIEPCILCLYQRVPYAIAALLGLAALLLPPAQRRVAMILCVPVFVLGAGLAMFHVGIEQHWWTSSLPGCGVDTLPTTLPDTLSTEDFQEMLAGPPPPACDEVSFRIFGLSLAQINVLLSLALAVLSWIGIREAAKVRPS